MKIGSIAVGRSGDKGSALDLTIVAESDAAWTLISTFLTQETAQRALGDVVPGSVTRYAVPGLRALKFVVEGALPGGVYATLHAGLHWQKAAIYALLDLDIEAS